MSHGAGTAMPWTGPMFLAARARVVRACRCRACFAASSRSSPAGSPSPQYVGVTLLIVFVNLAFFGVIWHAGRMVLTPAGAGRCARGVQRLAGGGHARLPVRQRRARPARAGCALKASYTTRATGSPPRVMNPRDRRASKRAAKRDGDLPAYVPAHLHAEREQAPPGELRLRVTMLSFERACHMLRVARRAFRDALLADTPEPSIIGVRAAWRARRGAARPGR